MTSPQVEQAVKSTRTENEVRASRRQIVKAYTRHYRDNDQTKAYVEWADGSRTEGDASLTPAGPRANGTHMAALFSRAMREGLPITHEVW